MNWSTLSHVIVVIRRPAGRRTVSAAYRYFCVCEMTEVVPAQQSTPDRGSVPLPGLFVELTTRSKARLRGDPL